MDFDVNEKRPDPGIEDLFHEATVTVVHVHLAKGPVLGFSLGVQGAVP